MGWNATQVSFAFSLRSVESGVMAPLVGWLIDKVGARKVVFTGIVLTGASLILMSRTSSLAYFYAAFALMAVGTSCALGLGPYVAAANWFTRKRTWAMAVMSGGYAMSGILGPILVRLIGQYGWRGALVIVGIAIWVVGIPLSMVIRHRPQPYGYLPDGESRSGPSDETASPSPESTTGRDQMTDRDYTVREAMVTRAFWVLILFGVLTGFAQSAIIVHEMPYLTSVGISRDLASWTILGITGCSLLGRLVFGWVGDKYDKRYLLAIGAAFQCVGVLIFAFIGAPWMIIPFILSYGFGYASQIPLWPSIRADYFGLKHYGAIGGLQSLSWTICGIAAPVLAGWVFDTQSSYRMIWLAYAAATAIAIPTVFSLKTTTRRR